MSSVICIAQAKKQHKLGVDIFTEVLDVVQQESVPPEIPAESTVVEALKLGRATILEKSFFDTLAKQLVSESQRKVELNETVTKMDSAQLTIDDINPLLWKFCQGVVAGKRLQ